MKTRKLNVKVEPITLNLSTYTEIINTPFTQSRINSSVCFDAETVSGQELHDKWQEAALIEAEQELNEYIKKYIDYVQRIRNAKSLDKTPIN